MRPLKESERLRSIAGSRILWRALLLAYAVVVVVILFPVLAASVTSDDSYWLLRVPTAIDGSYWEAFVDPIRHAFDFSGQARTTAISISERQVIALFAMDLATTFSIPPAFAWGLIKVALIAAMVASVAAFLAVHRFRKASGDVVGFSRGTRAFILIGLPLAIAAGAKSINLFSLNSWNHYPTLTYGPITVFLLVASFCIVAERALRARYRLWVGPVVVILVIVGVAASISYELIAIAIPVGVVAVLLQPLPDGGSRWERWRPRITVALALGGSYSAMFVWIRWRLTQMECHATDSCYAGTVIDVQPVTIVRNFIGAFPGRDGALVVARAVDSGNPIPVVGPGSIALGIIAAVLVALLWVAWRTRDSLARRQSGVDVAAPTVAGELRGTAGVVLLCAIIAAGGAVVTGISANSVAQIENSVLSYRSGVIIWAAVCIAALAVVRLATLARWRVVEPIAIVASLAIVASTVALYTPRNVSMAHVDRTLRTTQAIDAIHLEVALGDASAQGDARRCDTIDDYLRSYRAFSPRLERMVNGAYRAYDHYYGEQYCSTGLGIDAESGDFWDE